MLPTHEMTRRTFSSLIRMPTMRETANSDDAYLSDLKQKFDSIYAQTLLHVPGEIEFKSPLRLPDVSTLRTRPTSQPDAASLLFRGLLLRFGVRLLSRYRLFFTFYFHCCLRGLEGRNARLVGFNRVHISAISHGSTGWFAATDERAYKANESKVFESIHSQNFFLVRILLK